jgi:nicotinate-nucleotide adenylyltransferase
MKEVSMKELGLMGGTFNPIRERELLIGQRAVDQFGLHKLLFMTNGEPPHKRSDPSYELLDAELRWEMVHASVRHNRKFEASRMEVDRPGTTWTIDTLHQLRAEVGPCVRINFICGADTVKSLARYARRDEFLGLCRLLVAPRDPARDGMLDDWRGLLPNAQIELIDVPADSSSSSLVRDWIRQGISVRYLVPGPAYRILRRKKHYQRSAAAGRSLEKAS